MKALMLAFLILSTSDYLREREIDPSLRWLTVMCRAEAENWIWRDDRKSCYFTVEVERQHSEYAEACAKGGGCY